MPLKIYRPNYIGQQNDGRTHNYYASYGIDPTWSTVQDIQEWALLTNSSAAAKFNSAEVYANGHIRLSQLSLVHGHNGKIRVTMMIPGMAVDTAAAWDVDVLDVYLFH